DGPRVPRPRPGRDALLHAEIVAVPRLASERAHGRVEGPVAVGVGEADHLAAELLLEALLGLEDLPARVLRGDLGERLVAHRVRTELDQARVLHDPALLPSQHP